MVYTKLRFEWSPIKALLNESKHGIRFDDAITAFDDPFGLRVDDEKHSGSEPRQWCLAESDRGVIVVVFTVRWRDGVEWYRLISARRANRKERAWYEFNKTVPL